MRVLLDQVYSTSELFVRFNIFKANIDYIRFENSQNRSYSLG